MCPSIVWLLHLPFLTLAASSTSHSYLLLQHLSRYAALVLKLHLTFLLMLLRVATTTTFQQLSSPALRQHQPVQLASTHLAYILHLLLVTMAACTHRGFPAA
jgi:hypothetical protein